MMYQDTFTVPAELWLFIIEKQERRTFMTKSSAFLEYMKIHLISLNQDLEEVINGKSVIWNDGNNDQEISLNGQIEATEHLLSVATDIMNSTNERYNNDNI